MMTPRTPRFLSVKDVADLLGCCERTVLRRIKNGELHAHDFGRQKRISEEDYLTYAATARR